MNWPCVQVALPHEVSGCFDGEGMALRGKAGCTRLLLHDLIEVWNDKGPLLGSLQVPEDDFYFPVAMYVHNRPHYFERALHNLEKASGVERVPLLIISMDSINPGELRHCFRALRVFPNLIFHIFQISINRPAKPLCRRHGGPRREHFVCATSHDLSSTTSGCHHTYCDHRHQVALDVAPGHDLGWQD
jgi:hypothetical protein